MDILGLKFHLNMNLTQCYLNWTKMENAHGQQNGLQSRSANGNIRLKI